MGSYDLCTKEQVEAFYGLTTDTDDDLIDDLIEKVSAQFDAYCGRRLYGQEYDYETAEIWHNKNAILNGITNLLIDDLLPLPQWPIVDVTTVRINEMAIDESTGISVSGWYIFDWPGGILGLRGYHWSAGRKNIELVYNAGYDSTNTPNEWEMLEQACIEQVLWAFKQGKKDYLLGVKGKNFPDGSINLFQTKWLLPQVKATLDNFGDIRAF